MQKTTANKKSKLPTSVLKKQVSKVSKDSAIVFKPNPLKGGLKCKSWQDACAFYGYDPNNLPIVKHLPKELQEYMVNHYMLIVTIGAINEDKKPDWSNSNEWKYTIWGYVKTTKNGKVNPSGFGFAYTRYDGTYTLTVVGARLGFTSPEKRNHFWKYFEKMYTINQLYISANDLKYKLPA